MGLNREVPFRSADVMEIERPTIPAEGSSLLSLSCSTRHDDLTPISQLIFFHKAIRAELHDFHKRAVSLKKGAGEEAQAFLSRYHFIRAVYKYHSWAEDEVVFPALDARVKNVANAYTLEHQIESSLFDQLSAMVASIEDRDCLDSEFQSQLACCSEALSTVLSQHLAKEEEHVFPLLQKHFNSQEQSRIMRDFLTSLPVKLMSECLPWVASHLSDSEQESMARLMRCIIPREDLLQELFSNWMKQIPNLEHQWDELGSPWEDPPPLPWGNSAPKLPPPPSPQHMLQSDKSSASSVSNLTLCPIDEFLRWHDAMRVEIKQFAEDVANLDISRLESFEERLRFVASICQYHSIAEDEVVFPAVLHTGRVTESLTKAHAEDQEKFASLSEMLARASELGKLAEHNLQESPQEPKLGRSFSASSDPQMEGSEEKANKLLQELSESAAAVAMSILDHFLVEEEEVLPLLRTHCSAEEQRALVFQSLLVMPLNLLETVLPWLHGYLTEEEAQQMIQNMQLAAPKVDEALVKLLTRWSCKPGRKDEQECRSADVKTDQQSRSLLKQGLDGLPEFQEGSESEPGTPGLLLGSSSRRSSEEQLPQRKRVRFSMELSLGYSKEVSMARTSSGMGVVESPTELQQGRDNMPNRRFTEGAAPFPSSGDRSCSPSGSAVPRASELFSSRGSSLGESARETQEGPIDAIFAFHQALRKELDYLCAASRALGCFNEDSFRDFSGRFHFMWGLYKAHSSAEDSIVFPALEAKEALCNVSHSYSIDHKQEEELFSGMANLLAELSEVASSISSIRSGVSGAQVANAMPKSNEHPFQPSLSPVAEARGECVVPLEEPVLTLPQNALKQHQKQWAELAGKLARMCLSVRLALDQHVSREEVELWPLFGIHFTVEEQDKLIGRIIGATGAEVLQAMLTWITAALSDKEQQAIVDTWKHATKNTMFEEWLSNWWRLDAGAGPALPAPSESEDQDPAAQGHGAKHNREEPEDPLEMVAEYLKEDLLAEARDEPEASLFADKEGTAKKHSHKQEQSHVQDFTEQPGCHAQKRPDDNGSKEFKSGWHNIFRMNQTQLEAAIRKVSRDTSLDPRRKAYLMQNLMTSRWIVAQQKGPPGSSSDDQWDAGRCPSYADEAAGIRGCEHYQRNCKLKAACCGRLFPCRFCHDKVSDHAMERKDTIEMMCMKCMEVQPIGQHCRTPSCKGFEMARYYCNICKMLDNSREIYHCPFCNLCRVGKGLGVDYFHCMTCNACMSISLTTHKCREKGLEANCPICHDDLFTSSTPIRSLPCGHFMHSACFQAYTFEHYTCPVCWKSVGDMSVYFGMLDALLASEQLPEEYRDRKQAILCNDCERKGESAFHWLYHKCQACGSYNTKTL